MNTDRVRVESEVGIGHSSESAPSLETLARPAAIAPAAATGRRNDSVARVRIVPGTGEWTVNGRTLESYFPNKLDQQVVNEPFANLQLEGRFDVIARIHGGSIAGQVDALSLGVARCLNVIETNANSPSIKKAGLRTRGARVRQPDLLSVGRALADLSAEFPDEDIKEAKLRFLESEGLVAPERTPSGYRKYSVNDMKRLRYIIRAQREHHLPLKVIKEHLAAVERGDVPRPEARSGGGGSSLPRMDLAYVPTIETSLRALHARRVLDDIEEHRGVRDALQAGLTQVAIAKLLGKSQPTVHRIVRRLTADPSIADRSPREVIALATAGEIDRSTMLAELAVLDPQPGAGPDEPYLDGELAGDWDQVVEAWENGWLTDAEYDELAAR